MYGCFGFAHKRNCGCHPRQLYSVVCLLPKNERKMWSRNGHEGLLCRINWPSIGFRSKSPINHNFHAETFSFPHCYAMLLFFSCPLALLLIVSRARYFFRLHFSIHPSHARSHQMNGAKIARPNGKYCACSSPTHAPMLTRASSASADCRALRIYSCGQI